MSFNYKANVGEDKNLLKRNANKNILRNKRFLDKLVSGSWRCVNRCHSGGPQRADAMALHVDI